MVARFN